MNKIIGSAIIAALLLFAGCLSCPPCPREKINVPLMLHPALPPVVVPFEKGEFDKSDEERGYKIYSDEELNGLRKEDVPIPPTDSEEAGTKT